MDIFIRELTSADAQPLMDCFKRCYGDTYPNDTFYEVTRLEERIQSGQLRSVAAFKSEDNGRHLLVGHTGLNLVEENALISEAGNTVVDPAYRGHGILGRMGAELSTLCQQSGFKGYVHFPTTAHAIMQKQSVSKGGVETGLMLGYIPAETEYTAIEQKRGRIAATIAYQPIDSLPEITVYVPSAYEQPLREIYESCGLERNLLAANGHLSLAQASQQSSINTSLNGRRGLLSIIIEKIGADLAKRIDDALANEIAEIVHVDLMLDEPRIECAISMLKERQFFFAGLLPSYRRTDVLRLQRIADSALQSMPELVNEDAKRISEWIQREARERT